VFPDGRSTLVLADGMGGEGPSAEEANSHTPDVEFWVRLAAAFTGPAVTAAWVALLADTLALRAGGGVAQGCVRPRNKPFQKRKGFRRGFSEFNRGFDGLLRRRRRAGVRAPTKQNPYTSRPWCCRCPRLHARHVVHCEQPPQSNELCSGGWLMASVGWRRVFGVVRNYCVCGSCVCGWRWWGFDGLLKCARRKTPPPRHSNVAGEKTSRSWGRAEAGHRAGAWYVVTLRLLPFAPVGRHPSLAGFSRSQNVRFWGGAQGLFLLVRKQDAWMHASGRVSPS
jgi:hypothetical protein